MIGARRKSQQCRDNRRRPRRRVDFGVLPVHQRPVAANGIAAGIEIVELHSFQVRETFADEVEAIAEWLTGVHLSRTCLVARTNRLVSRYAEALEDRGIATRKVRRSQPDDLEKPGLRVATMHRVKGIEYDRMIIAGLSEDSMPLHKRVARSRDMAVRREEELMERALLYVAMTRAREAALITAHGKVSDWIGIS